MTHRNVIQKLTPFLIMVLTFAVVQVVWSEDEKPVKRSEYMAQYTGTDAELIGSEACILCHEDMKPAKARSHITIIDKNLKDPNYGYSCEGCHGPGGNHNGDITGILEMEKMNNDEITDNCSSCHEKFGVFKKQEWLLSEHYFSDVRCIECHGGHVSNRNFLRDKTELELCYACHLQNRAEFSMRSHHPVNEELMDCSSCHNPMAGINEYQLVKEGDNLCFECHADKQGPFVFDMGLGTENGGDGCLTCHFAHGSSSDSLLKYPRQLCISCHIDMRPPAHFQGDCWDCHVDVHGSNSDPLFLQ